MLLFQTLRSLRFLPLDALRGCENSKSLCERCERHRTKMKKKVMLTGKKKLPKKRIALRTHNKGRRWDESRKKWSTTVGEEELATWVLRMCVCDGIWWFCTRERKIVRPKGKLRCPEPFLFWGNGFVQKLPISFGCVFFPFCNHWLPGSRKQHQSLICRYAGGDNARQLY